jgi:hypothetical protein
MTDHIVDTNKKVYTEKEIDDLESTLQWFMAERIRLKARIAELETALEIICRDMGETYEDGRIGTAGWIGLENAFEALGWTDPHDIREETPDA